MSTFEPTEVDALARTSNARQAAVWLGKLTREQVCAMAPTSAAPPQVRQAINFLLTLFVGLDPFWRIPPVPYRMDSSDTSVAGVARVDRANLREEGILRRGGSSYAGTCASRSRRCCSGFGSGARCHARSCRELPGASLCYLRETKRHS